MIIAASVACRSKDAPPRERAGSAVATWPGAAAAAGSGSAATRPGEPVGTTAIDRAGRNMTGLRPHQGGNCPSSLPRTTTRIAMTPRGVDVTVTSTDRSVVRGIVALAERHVRDRTAEVSRPHDQKHGGPGSIGYCPVIASELTSVTVTPLPDGVTVHVDARAPSRVGELQDMVKQRAARMPGYESS